jgi:hypothetical protein
MSISGAEGGGRRRRAGRRASGESAPGSRRGCVLRYGLSVPGVPKSPRVGAHLVGRLLVDVGQAGADQVLGRAVHVSRSSRSRSTRAAAACQARSGGRPGRSRSRAIPPRRGSNRRTPALPSRGWCRRSAGDRRRRTRARARNSARCSWRGRCAGSRWARAESAGGPGPDRSCHGRGARHRPGPRPSGGRRRRPGRGRFRSRGAGNCWVRRVFLRRLCRSGRSSTHSN